MRLFKWFPWKYLVRRTAHAHGFLDPITLLAKIRKFAQPSEVSEPVELLRAGAFFHARGLVNARVIQQNLDWIWPFWVHQQFDPGSSSFLPRAFSLTHVNLTHRNWTAVGIPGWDNYPIVDPRGLVTPYWDGWSLDSWIMTDDGETLLPSTIDEIDQRFMMDEDTTAIVTRANGNGMELQSRVTAILDGGYPLCRIEYKVRSETRGWFAIALRPYNPEGISFVHQVELGADRKQISVEDEPAITLSTPAEKHLVSTYQKGDVYHRIPGGADQHNIECDTGMANSAALYRISGQDVRRITVDIRLENDPSLEEGPENKTIIPWSNALQSHARLNVPDDRFEYLYNGAIRTLLLLTPDWTYPGPYTYKRFWYRDAVFITHALLHAGLTDQAQGVVDRFPEHQNLLGYFHSQEGEWDSNGQVLWAYYRYCRLTGQHPAQEWINAVTKGAHWIERKRLDDDLDEFHAGLFPAGFSAEHLGNIDHYYWDDFWGIAGLKAAAAIHHHWGDQDEVERCANEAEEFMQAVERSLERSREIRNSNGIPASPHRRMDAGAIGSIVAGYPLQLLNPGDPRLLGTVEYLLNHCFYEDAFFQDMIHSGMNAYLTLQIAQILLDAGDQRYMRLVDRVAELASPTGQWPEAIHPRTGGGCMGDGHHAWASAEWILMMQRMFIRETQEGLSIGSGIPRHWLDSDEEISFGPTPTPYGELTVTIEPDAIPVQIHWKGKGSWRENPRMLKVELPGFESIEVHDPESEGTVELSLQESA